MKRILSFTGVLLILAGFQLSLADNSTPSPNGKSPTPAITPAPHGKHHKKKSLSKAVTGPTKTVTPSISATVNPMTTPTPTGLNKAMAKATETPTPNAPVSDTSAADGDQAYAAKDYAKALSAYGESVNKHGKTPEIEKKLLLAKFYAGQALEEESRKGIKAEENYIKSDDETHNLMVYGKRHPSRDAHLVTLSLAFLTPQLLGGDIGFTFFSHWNVGCGIGIMGFDPRLKYYFDGDNASFFLGAGLATYNFNLSSSIDTGSGNGNFSGTISGTFAHFTFGPSFQDKNGFFMEIPFDVGIANIKGSGSATGGNGNGSGSSSGSGSYNGIMGAFGFRWGYSI